MVEDDPAVLWSCNRRVNERQPEINSFTKSFKIFWIRKGKEKTQPKNRSIVSVSTLQELCLQIIIIGS